MTKGKTMLTPKWYEQAEHTVHSIDRDRQVHVFYFPNRVDGPKVIQFQAYYPTDAVRQISSLLESAIYELQEIKR